MRNLIGAGDHDAIINGNVDWVEAETEFPKVMDFPGAAGDYLDCGDPADVDFGSGDFCLSVWVNSDDYSSTHVFIGKDNNHSAGEQFILTTNNQKIRIIYYKVGNAFVFFDGPTSLTTGVWQHVLGQRRGNTFDTYINGELDGTGTTSGTHGAMQGVAFNLRLGGRQYPGFTQELNGRLAEARIYGRSFSAAEAWQFCDPPTRWDAYEAEGLERLLNKAAGGPPPAAPPMRSLMGVGT